MVFIPRGTGTWRWALNSYRSCIRQLGLQSICPLLFVPPRTLLAFWCDSYKHLGASTWAHTDGKGSSGLRRLYPKPRHFHRDVEKRGWKSVLDLQRESACCNRIAVLTDDRVIGWNRARGSLRKASTRIKMQTQETLRIVHNQQISKFPYVEGFQSWVKNTGTYRSVRFSHPWNYSVGYGCQ